ncbi:MAG: DUF5685 family protein [Oscillospiraceae bacterium]|nr:DUF5685 family protein [Oscillospiraceae bacterium]
MFGYIRPLQGELKLREIERFKACYCGLCHALGDKYGMAARLILNYELVFLAMLLWGEDETLEIQRRRCIASPHKKRRYCARNATLDSCAGYNVILAWWKLRDTAEDEGFIKSAPHRLLSQVLSRAYKKAAGEFPEFDANVRSCIAELREYESSGEKSLDGAADKFARMLCAAVPSGEPANKARPMQQLLYHLGRWIYITDARDDYEGDVKAGRYNPIANLDQHGHETMTEACALRLETTLSHSNDLVRLAFELLPKNPWSPIVENIIYLGMPYVNERVLDGTWKNRRYDKKPQSYF